MAAGDLITTDHQVEYNGVLLGNGDIEVVTIDPFAMPDLRTSDVAKPLQHGMFPGNDYASGKTIVIEIELWGDNATTLRDRQQEMFLASTPQEKELPLVIQLPGWGKVMFMARPRDRRGFLANLEAEVGKVNRGAIVYFATNPRLLDFSESTKSVSLVTSAINGLDIPIVFPLVFGAVAVSGSTTVTNSGSSPAHVRFTIDNEVTNPSIKATFPDGTIKTLVLTGNVDDGSTLVVDSSDFSVLLDGVNVYDRVQDSTQWFDLPPGTTSIEFGGSSNAVTAPTLSIAWRNSRI